MELYEQESINTEANIANSYGPITRTNKKEFWEGPPVNKLRRMIVNYMNFHVISLDISTINRGFETIHHPTYTKK